MFLQMRSKCSQLCSNSTICQERLNVSCVWQLWLYCSKNTIFDSSCLPSVYTASWPGRAWPWDNVQGAFRYIQDLCPVWSCQDWVCHCAACKADPSHDPCSVHGILFKYSMVQNCCFVKSDQKVHLSPAPCLCQRQVGVGSGGYNTSSQKCFHILQQLSQVCIFSLKGSVLWYPHRSAPGSSTIPILCFSELPLLTSSGSTCRDHVFLVQLCLVH